MTSWVGAARQRGFSLLTLSFLAAGVLGGIVFLISGSGIQSSGQVDRNLVAQLVAQGQLIAHRIAKCAADYPQGNNGSGSYLPYPLGSGVAVSTLVCPGNGQNLWSGVDGVYLPPRPTGFADWTYSKFGPVSIEITSLTPALHGQVLSTAASRLGGAARVNAGTLTLKIIE